MKAITTITPGQTIKRTEIYHIDNREMIGTFKVVGITKGNRFKIEIQEQFTNGNDHKKPFITNYYKSTVTLRTMLEMQYDFCRYSEKIELLNN
jgi:hypothetical protein